MIACVPLLDLSFYLLAHVLSRYPYLSLLQMFLLSKMCNTAYELKGNCHAKNFFLVFLHLGSSGCNNIIFKILQPKL